MAKKLKTSGVIDKDLTEAGVSVVNVGSTAFLRYSKIFRRKTIPEMKIPVSVITDVDVREYKRVSKKLVNKEPNAEVARKSKDEIKRFKKKYEHQNVKAFVAPHWTLEYSIYKSDSLSQEFQDVVKQVHPRIGIGSFEQKLASKLIVKTLDKIEIAYQLAHRLEEDAKRVTPEITINEQDNALEYLIKGIKYVCGN